MLKLAQNFLLLGAVLSLFGCASAVGVHENLPAANYMPSAMVKVGAIDVYREGDAPTRPLVRIAKVAAHGNGYADQSTLEKTLISEAKKVGADCLIIVGRETTKDETVGAFSSGMFTSSQIQRPHLYGVACKYSKVRLGIKWNAGGLIEYVFSGSPAERAGVVEGDKLIAINGQPFVANGFLAEKEISARSPGDKVILEFLTKSGEKVRKELVLDAA